MWQVWGSSYTTSELTNVDKTVKVTFDQNYAILGVRLWIVVYNNPTFTSLSLKVYSDNSGSKGNLIATSTNSLTKAEIITLANGVKEIYFDFDNLPIKSDIPYHFGLAGTGHSFSESSHIAWMSGWPDPVYQNIAVTANNLSTYPYSIYFIGATL